jgi:hypothetical protein
MTTMATEATIEERGNGFPDVGDYVPGDDGQLYRIDALDGRIQTGRAPGAANWVRATVTLADWDDVGDDEIAEAMAIVGDDE